MTQQEMVVPKNAVLQMVPKFRRNMWMSTLRDASITMVGWKRIGGGETMWEGE